MMRFGNRGDDASGDGPRSPSMLFPERQILIRTNGRVRYLTLSRRMQIGCVVAVGLAAAWTAAMTASHFRYDAVLARKDSQIAGDQQAYQGLMSEVADYQRKFTAIAEELADNQDAMQGLVEENTALQHRLSALQTKFDISEEQREQEQFARKRLKAEIERVEADMRDLLARNADLDLALTAVRSRSQQVLEQRDSALREGEKLTQIVAGLQERVDDLTQSKLAADENLDEQRAAMNARFRERHEALGRELEVQRTALTDKLEVLRSELASAKADHRQTLGISADRNQRIDELEAALSQLGQERQRVAGLLERRTQNFEQDLESLKADLEQTAAERDDAVVDRTRMMATVASLENQLDGLQRAQHDAVRRMIEQTVAQIDNLERVVGITGLEVSGLLAEQGADYAAQGGPFIAAPKPEGLPGERLQASLTALDQHIGHWEALRDVMTRMPFAAPLDYYHVTSSFGKRRDPMNRRWAMHYGLDMGAPLKTKVKVTAPGTVVRAGWVGRYGRMVEVDHGFGIRTLYGHLNKVLVETGQEVSFDEPVGLLGNSGRSTGAHLHYEVLFDGKPVDPMKFITAGQNVFQSEQDD